MKEHIIYKYEAFDGTMFDDAFECRDYEIREQAKNSSVVLLDGKWEELEINTDSIARCTAVICNSVEDIQFVKDIFNAEGYAHPFSQNYGSCEEKVGIYLYDEDNDIWINFDEKFEEAKFMYNRCLAYRR
jgi:hypothetical protein